MSVPERPVAVHLWLRATLDWSDERAFHAQLNPRFAPAVQLWNETFTLPFHRFRQRVRAIAADNHRQLGVPVVDRWELIPAGALVLPSDDDDWFAPDAGEALRGAAATVDAVGFHWPSRWVEVPTNRLHAFYLFRRRVFPWLRPKFVCTTNNYALVKRDGSETLLRSHVRASAWFDGCAPGDVAVLAQPLSIANRTLASQTTLGMPERTIGRRELVRKFHRYRRLYDAVLPSVPAWARPYVSCMADVMRELELRPER